ncbi:MAG: hypothetical protein OXE86_16480 [Alphaproteobacteria bacterium]|nr:hypothetical protein [Alphaproteobacteria bacterium]
MGEIKAAAVGLLSVSEGTSVNAKMLRVSGTVTTTPMKELETVPGCAPDRFFCPAWSLRAHHHASRIRQRRRRLDPHHSHSMTSDRLCFHLLLTR